MSRTRLLVITVGSALAGVVLVASPVSAGGWAMSSLDPMSVPVAGEETVVGFTIRQHGVTLVNPDDDANEPVSVAVRSAAGDEAVFPARQEGPTGHYVADVVFPEAGRVSWEIRQGWFGPHDLGPIDVADGAGGGAAAGGSDARWPTAARVGLVLVALAAAGVAASDVRAGRRRRAGQPVPL